MLQFCTGTETVRSMVTLQSYTLLQGMRLPLVRYIATLHFLQGKELPVVR